MDILDSIELTEEQSEAFIKKLNEWKSKIEEQKEKELDFFQEEIEAKTEEKYNGLFEEAKKKMQAVYSARLEEAINELYDTVKARNLKDLQESSEYQAMTKIKELIAPMIVEKGMIQTVDAKDQELASLKAQISSIRATQKLENLIKDLPEAVQTQIKEMIGEPKNEEQIVEEFNKAIKIMKLTKDTLEQEGYRMAEVDENVDPVEAIDPATSMMPAPSEGDSKKKKKNGTKNESVEFEDVEDDKINEARGKKAKMEPEEESSEPEEESSEPEESSIEDVEGEESSDEEGEEESSETPEDDEEESSETPEEKEDDDEESLETPEEEEEEEEESSENETPTKSKKTRKDIVEDILKEEEEADVVTKGDQKVITESASPYDAEKERIRHLAGIKRK